MECDGRKCGEGKYVIGNRYVCPHNNLAVIFPDLVSEWDPTNEKQMTEYLPGSHSKVRWICSKNKKCNCHIWAAMILDRTRSPHPRGCPFCLKGKVCEHSNLEILFPELKDEWHPNNPNPMNSYSPNSATKVKWICSKNKNCDCHIWETSISHRTANKNCPFCANLKLCDHNNLEAMFPEFKNEWHPDNPKSMNLYSPGSDARAKWICKNNSLHIWEVPIFNRTGKDKTGCPYCSTSRGYSISQINWLTEIEQKENICIQHALKLEGEFRISGIGKVDGYCVGTNTVYEYHGDYWHGNPLVYNHIEINPTNKKSYGELYAKTIERDNKIKGLGYKLVVKWESD